jgi:hypothetical protein
MIALDIEEVQKQRAARAGMDQYRQIRIARRLINRVEVRIVEGPVPFDTSEENSHSAIIFAPFDFLHRLFYRVERRHHHPAHAPAGFSA